MAPQGDFRFLLVITGGGLKPAAQELFAKRGRRPLATRPPSQPARSLFKASVSVSTLTRSALNKLRVCDVG